MTGIFKPYLKRLPPEQRKIWPELGSLANLGFTLYGGTGIALRLGHRDSVDFDFFTEKPLDREAIRGAFPRAAQSASLQDNGNTWVIAVPSPNSGGQAVKVSFFGTIAFGRVGEPDFTDDGVLRVASLDDLMATKVKVVLQRAEAKDYRDIATMIDAGVNLSKGLGAARQLYGPNFQPSESVKALGYFGDGDLSTLTAKEKRTLAHAVQLVRDVPQVPLRSKSLDGLNWNEVAVMRERIGRLERLKSRAGVEYTFWELASKAMHGGEARTVDWKEVERKTIIESISEHGQPASYVAEVILEHSPGAVTKESQADVLALIESLAPELQLKHERARNMKDHGLE